MSTPIGQPEQATLPEPPPPDLGGPPVLALPPVFHGWTFLAYAAGLALAPGFAAAAYLALDGRTAAASGLALAVGGLVALLGGVIGAGAGRRLGGYELAGAGALLLAEILAAALLRLDRLRAIGLPVAGWEAQGRLGVVLGAVLLWLVLVVAALVGASLGYLVLGTGRFDPSLSHELFVARSHLRLAPRTTAGRVVLAAVAALGGVVVLAPRVIQYVPYLLALGLVAALGWSFVRDVLERRATRRGQLTWRPRMPATLLMTLISIGGVAVGVWALTVVLSVMSGFEGDLKAKILGTNSHGMVMKYGNGNDFTEWRSVRAQTLAVPGVLGATPFLYNEVMVSAGQNLSGAVLKGIDPGTVGTVTHLPGDVLPEAGHLEWLDHPELVPPGDAPGAEQAGPGGRPLPGIAIGREMARTLRVSLGDVVNLISPLGDLGPAGPQPKSRPFRVAAVLYSGMYEYDAKFAYIQLGEAQRFFGTGDSVTGLELKVDDVDRAPAILRRVLAALEGYPYRVRDWGQLNRNLFSALVMEKMVMAVILAFIVLVASAIIVATLIMQVLDKRREIAVLKAMGAGQPSIMKIFVAEGLIIGALGTAFGLLLGYGTCLFIDRVGIPLDPEVYYISNLPVRMNPAEFALVALLAMVLSYLATLYPASKASRVEPVEGLRSE